MSSFNYILEIYKYKFKKPFIVLADIFIAHTYYRHSFKLVMLVNIYLKKWVLKKNNTITTNKNFEN